MNIPYDLNDIQPRANHIWNCDEIGFDTNGRWNKAIFTYTLFQGGKICKVKTREQAPLWCTLFVFTRFEGNASCHPSLFTNPRSTPKITNLTFQCT